MADATVTSDKVAAIKAEAAVTTAALSCCQEELHRKTAVLTTA